MDTWSQGSKAGNKKQEEKEEKRRAELARKAEIARLLAEEEASAPAKVKATPKAGAAKKATPKKDVKPAGPGAIAAGGGLAAVSAPAEDVAPKEPEAYSATGIDNAIDLLEVVNAKMDKASIGTRAADIERHPEVRCAARCCFQIDTTTSDCRGDSRPRLRRTRRGSCQMPRKMYVCLRSLVHAIYVTHKSLSDQHPGLRLNQYHVRPTLLGILLSLDTLLTPIF